VTLSHDFWRDRRVLLTGHTGFKGAWASLMLNVLGAKISGVALAPEAGPNEADTHGVADVVETFIGHWGEGAGWTAAPGSHPHEAHALRTILPMRASGSAGARALRSTRLSHGPPKGIGLGRPEPMLKLSASTKSRSISLLRRWRNDRSEMPLLRHIS